MYLLWSARNSGWLSRTSTYTTDQTEALTLPRGEALARCKVHKSQGGYQLLPVSLDDLGAI